MCYPLFPVVTLYELSAVEDLFQVNFIVYGWGQNNETVNTVAILVLKKINLNLCGGQYSCMLDFAKYAHTTLALAAAKHGSQYSVDAATNGTSHLANLMYVTSIMVAYTKIQSTILKSFMNTIFCSIKRQVLCVSLRV